VFAGFGRVLFSGLVEFYPGLAEFLHKLVGLDGLGVESGRGRYLIGHVNFRLF
jgi:hypothetical protein